MRKIIALFCGIAICSLGPITLAKAKELGDGTYLCEGGLTTGIQSLDRQWTPVGQVPNSYVVTLSGNSTKAVIEKMEYQCQTRFFEFLGCTTGLYHFGMNINNGRFIFDQSYGFIRGETPGGDAEIVTTTLGYCRPAPAS